MVRTQQSLCSQFLFNPPKDKRSYHLNIHLPCQPPSFVYMLKQQLRFSFQIHLASSRLLVTIECFSGAITTVLWLFLQEEQHHVPVAWCRTRRGISYLNHLHDSKYVLLCVWLRWFFWWWWSFTYPTHGLLGLNYIWMCSHMFSHIIWIQWLDHFNIDVWFVFKFIPLVHKQQHSAHDP
jgi:hypothetical protein